MRRRPLPGGASVGGRVQGDLLGQLDSIVPGDCPGWYTILRTYTAQDDADNDTTAVQTIQVVDTLAPVFTYVPEAVILECNSPWCSTQPGGRQLFWTCTDVDLGHC